MKLTVVLTIFFGTLILACSSADVPSADPTPNVDATVEARVDQERAVDTSIKANEKESVTDQSTETTEPALTPTPIPVAISFTPTPKPKPTATRVRPTWTPVPVITPWPTSTPTPWLSKIEILNYSSYRTSDIEEWVTLAESKMKDRSSSIFAFIYPVGKYVSDLNFEGRHMNQHEMMLSQNEIETILSSVEA
jgi:hypothetical protein